MIAERWPETVLGDVVRLKRGFDLPDQQRRPGEIAVVSSSGVTGFHDTSAVAPPGVVTGRYGTLGEVFYLTEPFWPLNTTLFVEDFRGNNPRFVAYLLQSLPLAHHSDKSSVPGLNRNDLHTIRVKVPPRTEQESIAETLGALDDKIELNRRMNQTLEAMARAVFRSWFVDFDPVVAKAEGRQPFGMDAETAALFPSHFVESELGPIPDGWLVGSIGDIATNLRRIVEPGSMDSGTPYIGLEHMPRRCIVLSEWGRAGDVSSAKTAFVKGEILFGKLRPYFHKIGVALCDGVCSTDVLVVVPREKSEFGLVLGHLSSVEFVDYTDAASGGTRMPRTSWADMARYRIGLVPRAVCQRFNSFMRPVVEQFETSSAESRTLAKLRDTLLPKLFSGEIRIRDAEKKAEAAL